VGEQLTPLSLPEPWFVVVVPPVSVSTAEIFSAPELTRDCPPITIRAFLSGADRGLSAGADCVNGCEPVVRARYPQVDAALRWLGRYGAARMTGTGACCFAPFAERERAQEALARLSSGWSGFVARGCNRSPLLERLERAEG